MQNAKDTFYEVIRNRLAALNASRTQVVRGVVRPGALVEENELPSVPVAADCFRFSWTGMDVETRGALPLITLICEVRYETCGSSSGAGLDRGRSLEAMDAEILSAVTSSPMRTIKMNYAAEASGGNATSLNSTLWWGAPSFGDVEVRGERLSRVATIKVMSYQEAGEL